MDDGDVRDGIATMLEVRIDGQGGGAAGNLVSADRDFGQRHVAGVLDVGGRLGLAGIGHRPSEREGRDRPGHDHECRNGQEGLAIHIIVRTPVV